MVWMGPMEMDGETWPRMAQQARSANWPKQDLARSDGISWRRPALMARDGQDGTNSAPEDDPPVDPPVDPPMETMEITLGGMGSWSDDGQDYVFHGTWPEDATWQYMLDEWDVIFVGPDGRQQSRLTRSYRSEYWIYFNKSSTIASAYADVVGSTHEYSILILSDDYDVTWTGGLP